MLDRMLPHWPTLLVLCGAVLNADQSTSTDFESQIAPLLARRCLSCHSGDDPKGELNLSTRVTTFSGGASGEVILPRNLDESLLWQYVSDGSMPPKQPLPEHEKQLLREWIVSGAEWDGEKIDPFRFSTQGRAGYDWWSLQPITKPIPPSGSGPNASKNPIDAFVHARLREANLAPSSPAGKRTLIRRLSFDLLGLPPAPEDIENFLADDSDKAYERLVDRLLASPHYGERWARHWLDVVRFGESNGFEYDQPRDNAWHYRNWVIHALNQDMPYNEFVRQQLAGDVLYPQDRQAIAAAGFLVAGPHNTTLPSSKKMQRSMRQDELEDLVATVGQTFLGLTVNCGRCHDHKFDPISQQEYYELTAALSGVTHGVRSLPLPMPPEQQQRLIEIDAQLGPLRERITAIDNASREAILKARENGTAAFPDPPRAMARWEFDTDLRDSLGTLHATAVGGAKLSDGHLVFDGKTGYVVTAPLPVNLQEKTLEAWVQLDTLEQRGGGVIGIQTLTGNVFDSIVFGERETHQWMAGSNAFARYKPFQGDAEQQADKRLVHVAIVYDKDGTITGYREGQPYGKPYKSDGNYAYKAQQAVVVFGMRHAPAGRNKMLAGRIHLAQLYDRALTAEEVALSAGVASSDYVPMSQVLENLTEEQRTARERLGQNLAELESEAKPLREPKTISMYTCISKNSGKSHVLKRGNVADPGDVVSPGGLRALQTIDADFGLEPDAPDADRRRKLAEWITHSQNPLFARVIVNRLWHYHFGRGLVATTSDFGFNGGKPSHPELLDHLASEFQRLGYRLKPLHRMMVTSATYRQSSKTNPDAAELDADNRLMWRKSPHRLEAEAIRDAVLRVTGALDEHIGGRGYRDVRHYEHRGSNFYEPVVESAPETRRRTIYRFTPRGGRNPFLDLFDCPDPSTTAPQRASTTTPLQALALMNNELIFRMADAFATRVVREAGNVVENQAQRTILLAYGRPSLPDETALASQFVREHGLAAFCRVVLNSNEFLYVQ